MTDRTRARQLAAEALADGDPIGWFERLYAEAAAGATVVPWADLAPNPHLVSWWDPTRPTPARALVVGCGLGDDAAWLAAQGVAEIVGFDIAPTAVAAAVERFGRIATFTVADALAPPADWRRAFDFVFEAYTLQVLPAPLRARCAAAIAGTVAPGGTLLVVARGRDPEDDEGAMPWPLLRAELAAFETSGLELVAFDDFLDDEDPPARRFVAELRLR